MYCAPLVYEMLYLGFSFGGLLACCCAARLWKESCTRIETLERSVMCITFGQPLIDIPYVQDTIKNCPTFENNIHSIYDKEDVFPKLLRNKYKILKKIEQSTSVKALTSGNGHHSPPTTILFPPVTEANVSVIVVVNLL